MGRAIIDDVDVQDHNGRPRVALIVLLVLAVVAAVVVVVALTRDGGGGAGDGAAGVDRGGLALTGVELTDVEDGIDPATGLPTSERDGYEVGEGARLWVQFTYDGDAPGQDALFVRWYRDGNEIFQSSWRLPQPVENHNVALGASYMEEPGAYRVEVLLNDDVLQTVNFTVD